MEIKKQFPSITIDDLSNLEYKIGLNLPEEYKQFILVNNGGYPLPNKFDFVNSNGETSDSLVDYFLPIGHEYDNNVAMVYEYFTGEERLPVGMIPIAYDPFGNMVCINLAKERLGTIFFWDHELEFEDSNLSIVASSFNEFINMLH